LKWEEEMVGGWGVGGGAECGSSSAGVDDDDELTWKRIITEVALPKLSEEDQHKLIKKAFSVSARME